MSVKNSRDEFKLIGPCDGKLQFVSAVTLSCHLSPINNAVAMEIRWFIVGADCVCLYNNVQVIEGRGYEDRVSLFTQELQGGNVSLQLRDYGESDTGDYLCQVSSRDRTEDLTVRVGKYIRAPLYINSTSPSVVSSQDEHEITNPDVQNSVLF